MASPRKTRLVRTRDLTAFRATLIEWIATLSLVDARDTAFLLPTRAAAEQLRRSVEGHALLGPADAIVWPLMTTRQDLYAELATRLDDPPVSLSSIEREVMLAAVARDVAEAGVPPPFDLRPGLIAEMLALYDQIRRLGRQVGDFERNLCDELEPARETDRGAAQLLEQTRYLAAVFRGYEARLDDGRRVDEHVLRDRLRQRASRRPLRRVVVTIGDRLADPDGYWPADLSLLTRLPGLEALEVISTEAMLGTGFLERLQAELPDLEDVSVAPRSRPAPALVTPPPESAGVPRVATTHRDREEELIAVARRLKAEHRAGTAAPLHRTALVVRRPLPYLYLARDVLVDAGVPFETLDTLPLAAEPYAAALDLTLDAAASDFTRETLLALLRSPHFRLAPPAGAGVVSHVSLAACDAALAEARYLGGLDRLTALAAAWRAIGVPASRHERRQQMALPAIDAGLAAAQALAPLTDERPVGEQIATIVTWLRRFDRAPDLDDPTRSRRLRVQGAVLGTLGALAAAYDRHDPFARADVATLAVTIRRWLGTQTFAVTTGEPGLQILDAQSARYAEVDDLQIVGLIDGEWPERPRRSVLYPASLLSRLEPLPATPDPSRRERDQRLAARAGFRDLVHLPAARIRLSTFALEHDAVVEPSMLLDDVAAWGLTTIVTPPARDRVLVSEALALDPPRGDLAAGPAAAWAAARLAPGALPDDRFHGQAGAWRLPRVSVSRLERYLDCPFRFYGSEVLRLEEQPEDEDTRTPLERGRFLHELWERFFSAWQSRGYGRIEPEKVPEAQALFTELCEAALQDLSPSEAALERVRLLGSAVSPGIAHRIFAMEADRPLAIVERLLEYPLEGDFTFTGADGESRVVTLNAKTDRIDVLADGTLRVIDYKSRKTPDQKQALQLPIYSHVAQVSLAAARGREFPIAEAMYVSFEGDKAVVPLKAKGQPIDEIIAEAQARLLDTLDRIAAGVFPPRPARRGLCGPCPYRLVCRLDIVEAQPETDGD